MNFDKSIIYPTQIETQSYGKLQVYVYCELGGRPVENAIVRIFRMGNPNVFVQEELTDLLGRTPVIELPTPSLIYSLEPSDVLPYSEYVVQVIALGLQTVEIFGTQVFPTVTAIQQVYLPVIFALGETKKIIITPHTLVGNYPMQVKEDEIKVNYETGKPVIIPEYVKVHTGLPTDELAINICDRYKEYIKNVVCNEIYPTWPQETIYANILATMSFTLNRIYTNWYPNQGYDFDITSSNAFDNKWIFGRNYYDNICLAVDQIFNQYLSRPGIIQPILTQYCKGELIYCFNMMEKWISKTLGSEGYNTIEILRYFYGETIYINSTMLITGLEYPWPGINLTVASTGDHVAIMQDQLNAISKIFTTIPNQETNGNYNQATVDAVKIYQQLFGLPITGDIDFTTWHSIAMLYAGYIRSRSC